MNESLTYRIDNLILDSYLKSSDIIIQGRRAQSISPINSNSLNENNDKIDPNSQVRVNYTVSEYCSNNLKPWKRNLSAPLIIDIYIENSNDNNKLILMERWKLVFKRLDDLREGRISSINRRIVTLLRTLYSFVRILPGFQLLHVATSSNSLRIHMYNPDSFGKSTNFSQDTSIYEFPRVVTPRGVLSLGVRYIKESQLLKLFDIPKSLGIQSNPIALPSSLTTTRQRSGSSTIPIPIPTAESHQNNIPPSTGSLPLPPPRRQSIDRTISNRFENSRTYDSRQEQPVATVRIGSYEDPKGQKAKSLDSKPSLLSDWFSAPQLQPKPNSKGVGAAYGVISPDRRPPLHPDINMPVSASPPLPIIAHSASPTFTNASPPFSSSSSPPFSIPVVQGNYIRHGINQNDGVVSAGPSSYDEPSSITGNSPPFVHPSINLLSTSPHLIPSLTIHSMRESLRRISSTKVSQVEIDIDIKVNLPTSPFDILTSGENINDRESINGDNEKEKRYSSDRDSLLSVNKEKDLAAIFDNDFDDNLSDDDDMPFAWAQSDNVLSYAANSTQPIAQLCVAPPPLLSFQDGPIESNGMALAASVAEQLKIYKEFRLQYTS